MIAHALPAPTQAELARPGLMAHLDRIRRLLQAYRDGEPAPVLDPPPCWSLDRVVAALQLSPFERDVLLLAAGVELDAELATLVGELGGDSRPTFALALAICPDAHWDALTLERPLRRWKLIDLAPGTSLVARPMACDELILHRLVGLVDRHADVRGLATASDRLGDLATLTTSQLVVADELFGAVTALDGAVLVTLRGPDPDAVQGVAARLAEQLGLDLLVVRDAVLAEKTMSSAAHLLDREALLGDRLPMTAHAGLLPLLESPVLVCTGAAADGPAVAGRTVVARAVGPPTVAEQAGIWADALGDVGATTAAAVADLAHHYRLSARNVAAIAAEWTSLVDRTERDSEPATGVLRRLARERARVGLGTLAERIEPQATWADLVLPPGQRRLLADLTDQLRHRVQVYDTWGFAAQSARGLGVTAVFCGESGTGKTMAAEVVAGSLGLDLYRIDLSAVVSKYIGETEKNLRSVFDSAEAGGAVLLFDEADALFGRRSEVKDSHDRYANLEVAYLLQRMEAYRGLAILTTNLRANLDPAFLRRLRFVIQFPFPNEAARAEIWQRTIPAAAPVDGLDLAALGKLQVSGGSIRSIALAAAFAAAADGTPIGPAHVLHAAVVEYAKIERSLTAAETAALTAALTADVGAHP